MGASIQEARSRRPADAQACHARGPFPGIRASVRLGPKETAMAPLPLVFRSATELARLLRTRKVRAPELLDLCLDQYARHNASLNAVVVTDIERARKAALASDRRLKRGKPMGPFDGVPMTIKESFDW